MRYAFFVIPMTIIYERTNDHSIIIIHLYCVYMGRMNTYPLCMPFYFQHALRLAKQGVLGPDEHTSERMLMMKIRRLALAGRPLHTVIYKCRKENVCLSDDMVATAVQS